MNWWSNWIGRIFTARDPSSPLYQGIESWAGENVNAQTALKLSAWWACTRLISQVVATLPLSLYQRLPTGERVERRDHPLYRLLAKSPNADQTALEFWEGRVFGLCTGGNGYAEKVMSNGRILSLENMPYDTFVRRLESGKLEYRYSRYGKEIIVPEERIFHVRGFGDCSDGLGLSPVAYARQTLGLSQATDRAAAEVYSKGLRAKGFFTTPGLLKPEQRDQIEKNLISPFTGPNAKQWGVLEAGVDIKTVSISPRDAELIASRQFNIEDVCRWMGVPPIMVGHNANGVTAWGTGIEQVTLGFYKTALLPYLERIEQRISKDLLSTSDEVEGIYAEFNVEGLLRGDSVARADQYSKLIQNAVMTPDEARAKENLPKMPGGEKLYINSTLVPLDKAGINLTPTNPAKPTPPQGGA